MPQKDMAEQKIILAERIGIFVRNIFKILDNLAFAYKK
jgi:hypothetical protein